MPDGTRGRVVAGPAQKATGYGLAASLGSVGKILGEAIDEVARVLSAVGGVIDFWRRAHAAPVPDYVAYARRLWLSEIVPGDKMLAPVLLIDVKWFTQEASALTKNSAFTDLARTGFAAWTNSSTSVLVYPVFGAEQDLKPVDIEIRKVLLRHEATHVLDFLRLGDRPPLTYHEMAVAETKAYTGTLADLDKIATAKPALAAEEAFVAVKADFQFLQAWFAERASWPATADTDRRIRREMVDWKDRHGDASPLLPASAGNDPLNLYLR